MNNDSLNHAPGMQTVTRHEFWQRHVSQWRTSGLSKAAYSEQYDLTYHQMVYWSAKFEAVVEVKPAGGFVPVSVSQPVGDADLSIRLPNGITIEGFNERCVDVIAKLIAQL